jgi:hypothetical protein
MRDEFSGIVIDIAPLQAQYFAIPKIACSSIMSAVIDALGIGFPESEWKPELFQTHKWDHLYDRNKVVLTKRRALQVANRWRFAFVRNPWDRLVSCYAEKIRDDGDAENFSNGMSKILEPYGIFKRGMAFEDFARAAISVPDFLADPHWRSQNTFVVDEKGRLPLNFIGHFESIQEDMAKIGKSTKAEFHLPHLLASTHRPYREYYSRGLREAVADRYREDIRLFGYRF